MRFSFNHLLSAVGIDPADVRLLRHKDQRALKGRSPYEMWRDDRDQFELYQSTQSLRNRSYLTGKYWAAFIGTPADETLFIGLYRTENLGLSQEDFIEPHTLKLSPAGSCDKYRLELVEAFREYDGRLFIDWGPGLRSWIQRADKQDKPILELSRVFREPDFPGYLQFLRPLSTLDRMPISWITALKVCRGIYLLTCPRTKEQYVGSATGEAGFWGRWQQYLTTGHGGNVELKIRDPSDYQVSILEMAGSSATTDEILQMESLWKQKLQSREMGLNRN